MKEGGVSRKGKGWFITTRPWFVGVDKRHTEGEKGRRRRTNGVEKKNKREEDVMRNKKTLLCCAKIDLCLTYQTKNTTSDGRSRNVPPKTKRIVCLNRTGSDQSNVRMDNENAKWMG